MTPGVSQAWSPTYTFRSGRKDKWKWFQPLHDLNCIWSPRQDNYSIQLVLYFFVRKGNCHKVRLHRLMFWQLSNSSDFLRWNALVLVFWTLMVNYELQIIHADIQFYVAWELIKVKKWKSATSFQRFKENW